MDYRSNSTDSPAASSQVELSNFSNYNEKSSVSELNCRKRKAVCGGKLSKADRSTSAKEKKAKLLAAGPGKDYIHVRARRGQATDRHSLAERVRREKISQRMKLLQDLVPGCDKVSGEAAMLDEIINYVESLQRQVQFLSMKLASIDPGLDFNLGNVQFKNVYQQSANMPQNMCHLGSSAAAAEEELYNHHTTVFTEPLSKCSLEPLNLDAKFCNKLGLQMPSFGGFCEILTQDFEDDLQRIVRMCSGHNSVNITGNYNRVKFQKN